LYESADRALDSGDGLLASQIVFGGGHSFELGSFTAPRHVDPSTHYLLIVADSNHALSETNETNNIIVVRLSDYYATIVTDRIVPTVGADRSLKHLSRGESVNNVAVSSRSFKYLGARLPLDGRPRSHRVTVLKRHHETS
jgi:hypothetical protein